MTEEELFHAALAKPPAERAAFLAQACSGNAPLRAAVTMIDGKPVPKVIEPNFVAMRAGTRRKTFENLR